VLREDEIIHLVGVVIVLPTINLSALSNTIHDCKCKWNCKFKCIPLSIDRRHSKCRFIGADTSAFHGTASQTVSQNDTSTLKCRALVKKKARCLFLCLLRANLSMPALWFCDCSVLVLRWFLRLPCLVPTSRPATAPTAAVQSLPIAMR